jgi:hypothetical protein
LEENVACINLRRIMAYFEQHCKDCMDQLGEPFENVNLWLDEYYAKFGSSHREIRHNELGVEKVRDMWGDKAALAAEIHIKRDEGCIPKVDEHLLNTLKYDPELVEAFIKEYGGEIW